MKKKKRGEADLGESVSRHVFRVYNELSGLWKNLEKILIPESRSLWMDFSRRRDFSVTFRTFETSSLPYNSVSWTWTNNYFCKN